MTLRARADRPVAIRPADRMAREAALRGRRFAFQADQRIGRPLHGAVVVLLGKRHLLGRERRFARHGRIRRCRVPAAQELLVLGLMALRAVGRRQVLRDRETAVLHPVLVLLRPVTIQAGHPHRRVAAALELDDHRLGLLAMALGALAAGSHHRRIRLRGFDGGPARVHDQGGGNQRDADGHGNEDGAERHQHASNGGGDGIR